MCIFDSRLDTYDTLIDEVYKNLIEEGVLPNDDYFVGYEGNEKIKLYYSDYPNMTKEEVDETCRKYSQSKISKKTTGKRYLYTYTTSDEYEFPIAVCDTIEELARTLHYPVEYVKAQFEQKNPRYHKIKLTKKDCEEISNR